MRQVLFTNRYPVADALCWELHKNCLANALIEVAGGEDGAPDELVYEDWQGEVRVEGDTFVVELFVEKASDVK